MLFLYQSPFSQFSLNFFVVNYIIIWLLYWVWLANWLFVAWLCIWFIWAIGVLCFFFFCKNYIPLWIHSLYKSSVHLLLSKCLLCFVKVLEPLLQHSSLFWCQIPLLRLLRMWSSDLRRRVLRFGLLLAHEILLKVFTAMQEGVGVTTTGSSVRRFISEIEA